ncbi:MAG: hypothetical protein WBM86_20755, partial [Waterburya sp.]
MVRINLPTKVLSTLLSLGAIAFTSVLIQPALATTEIQSQSYQDLLLKGRIAYKAGRYTEAKTIWQEANQQYLTERNNLERALS